MNLRTKLERAKALRRLYERQLNKVPSKLPEGERRALAASAMDELVGPRWRGEITLVAKDIAAAPPTSSLLVRDVGGQALDDRLRRRVAEYGDHPDSVPSEEHDCAKDNAKKALLDLHAKICGMLKLL